MMQPEQISMWQALQRRTKHGDIIFWLLTLFFSPIIIFLVATIGYVIWTGSREARQIFGLTFLFQQGWNPVTDNFGAAPAIYGTRVSSDIALLIAGPPGVLIGVFLAEYPSNSVARAVRFCTDILSAAPSIVNGVVAYALIVQRMRQFSGLTGSIALATPMVPIITRNRGDFDISAALSA